MRDCSKKEHITFFFSTFRAGGGERVMVILANEFAARGYAVDAVVLKSIGEFKSHLDPRITVIDLDAWRMLFSLPKLAAYMWKARPRVMVATDEYTHILALVTRFVTHSKTRIMLRIGNMYSELYGRYSGAKRHATFLAMKKMYRYADAVVANSRGVADDITKLAKLNPDRVTVIYNPKHIDELQKAGRAKSGCAWLDEKTLPVVLGVGRLREQKNFALLVRAFARVVKEVPSRLIIVGGGREEGALSCLIQELDLDDSVKLVGHSDNPYAYMTKADVFAFSSLWEGMPNVLVEAMICGLPVVAADCPSGPREILAPDSDYKNRLVHGSEQSYYGILVAVNDEIALANGITKMLTDKELNSHYRKASINRAKDFDAEKIMASYADAMGV